ncbi:MAG: CcoQ/FixQ family Cbb3-type cytochrome c oxidase assembly chaperone [Candidatus Krumholzibacteriia bacterium]
MYQEFYARSGLLVWPLVGLILFLAVFIGVLAFTFFGLRDRRRIDEIAALPLEPDSGIDCPAEGRAR